MSLSSFRNNRAGLAIVVGSAAILCMATPALTQVVVAEDFLYRGQSTDVGDNFSGGNKFGTQDYGGGQNGIGVWDQRWSGFGSAAIIGEDIVAEPFASNVGSAVVSDTGGSGGADLIRDYSFTGGAGGVTTLWFGGSFLATAELSDMFASFSPFTVNGDGDASAVGIGIRDDTFFGAVGDTFVTGDAGLAGDQTNDASYHRIVGKLELNAGAVVADYNNDGFANAADYTIFRDTFGSTSDLRADGDNSGEIDQADYDLWAANFGASPLERLTVLINPSDGDTSAGSTLTVEGQLFDSAFDDGGATTSALITGTVTPDNEAEANRRHFVDDIAIGLGFDDVATVDVPRLSATVNTTTGAVSLVNNTSADVEIAYYEIVSESGSLDPSGWSSLEDQSTTGWLENSSATDYLAESNLLGGSTLTASGGTLVLGDAFDTTGTQDLIVRYGTLEGLTGFLGLATVEASAALAIPEPTAALLACFAGLGLICKRT